MRFYSLMSGNIGYFQAYSHDWIFAWIAIGILGILSFLVYMAQQNDYLPVPFDWRGCLLGVAGAFITITLTGAYKIALVVGVIIFCLGGWFVGQKTS